MKALGYIVGSLIVALILGMFLRGDDDHNPKNP